MVVDRPSEANRVLSVLLIAEVCLGRSVVVVTSSFDFGPIIDVMSMLL